MRAAQVATVRLSDGRRLRYAEFGSEVGRPVIGLHGTPGSHLKFAAADEIASNLGLRLICPDRWGYGGSDAPERPTLASYAEDIAELTKALGLQRSGVIGISGGGPFATGVAARLGASKISALALVSPVGILAADDRLSMMHTIAFRILPKRPRATRAIFEAYRALVLHVPNVAARLVVMRGGAADRALLGQKAVRSRIVAMFRAGLEHDAAGPQIDVGLFGQLPELAALPLRMPIRLWQGDEDRNVPAYAAFRLAAKARATTIRLQGQGHLWIIDNYREVLGWLAQHR